MTPYYKKQLESGLIYQDFVYEILHKNGISTVAYGSKVFQQRLGENKARIEIKFDDKLAQTGNLWIEVSEKSDPKNAEYVASGIYRDCDEYLIGDYRVFYRFATSILRLVHKTGRHQDRENNLKTSWGFLLPKDEASRIATKVYSPECAEQMRDVLTLAAQNRVAARTEMMALLQVMKCDPSQGKLFE